MSSVRYTAGDYCAATSGAAGSAAGAGALSGRGSLAGSGAPGGAGRVSGALAGAGRASGSPVLARSAAGELAAGNTVSPFPAAPGTCLHSRAIALALSRTTATHTPRHLLYTLYTIWNTTTSKEHAVTWRHGVGAGGGRPARRGRLAHAVR